MGIRERCSGGKWGPYNRQLPLGSNSNVILTGNKITNISGLGPEPIQTAGVLDYMGQHIITKNLFATDVVPIYEAGDSLVYENYGIDLSLP